MSGLWVRCPNCDLEVKIEMVFDYLDGNIEINPDLANIEDHARNCEERKHGD